MLVAVVITFPKYLAFSKKPLIKPTHENDGKLQETQSILFSEHISRAFAFMSWLENEELPVAEPPFQRHP